MKPRFVHNKKSRNKNTKQKIDIRDIDYISITNENDHHLVMHVVRESMLNNEDSEEDEKFVVQYSGDMRDGYRLCKNCGYYNQSKYKCKCEKSILDINDLVEILKEELEEINNHKVSINGKPIKNFK